MIDLPKITNIDISGKRVLLRLDLDCNPDPNDPRIIASEETLNYLKEKQARVIIIAHRGRPNGVHDDDLSLREFQTIFGKWGAEIRENLRFDKGEEENSQAFARQLASLGDIYINEAFAASHREHASITGVPKFLPHAAGFRFENEIENLSKVFENSAKPVVSIIGGAKEDKLSYLDGLAEVSDSVLVGGALPNYIPDESKYRTDAKFLIANLIPDREDMTIRSIENFEAEIAKGGTILLTGPMGKYEEEGHLMGTKRVFAAVAASSAFKIAGGGDTIKAVSVIGLRDKFDWLSVGGGAALEFITKRTLPGIEALVDIS